MDLKPKIYTTELDGETIKLEVSGLAGQANGAVIGHYGDTVVLATAVMGKNERDTDYFPLTVDYEERFYAAGKIIGSRFIRREGRPSDEATLSARLIDRTIRPLFDPRLRCEIQVIVTVLSYDERNDPDTIGLLASSTALMISDIPWNGPVAGIKTQSFKEDGSLEYQSFFAGPENKINMIEFEGKEIGESKTIDLFNKSQESINKLIDFQKKIAKEIGKTKIQVPLAATNPKLVELVHNFIIKDLPQTLKNKTLYELKDRLMEHLKSSGEPAENLKTVDQIFENEIDKFVHRAAIEKGERVDGRKPDQVRDLHSQVGLFKRTHGSGLFMRGETQILAVTTLATPSAEQLIETMETTGRRRFMLHYNFPSFATGETGRSSRGPGRREIGHGALAAKALIHMIPSKEVFPYTIRIVAETLSSNGSSSMASVCAGSLSLMDAGVPLPKHIAGIAMGLMYENDKKYQVLTDIQGPEDHYGDMDLKVAGTETGITALQMDVKNEGINIEIFNKALENAKKARLHIIETMKRALPEPRPAVSTYAPMILTLQIPQDKIGLVIGPGGRTINGILAATGNLATIDIEDDGKIFIASTDADAAKRALMFVTQIVKEYKVGEIVEGTIVKLLDFGAILDLGGDKDGLIHVSELKDGYVKKVDDVVNVGDRVRAKVIRVDPDGRIGLSLKGVG
ncbi:polyribonucleotide nucleotidyltransferase [Candidatus Jorgensenbacteria bacterium]|nr:polyribonucleotide nucleotidyltransferase [Candidatus Jorgensenbacteria bacterium]